ncbi:MAG: N-acetylglutamate synthase [Mycobacterium sp.]|nr:N-acetylglutamate synthase [Mycobacterium sp.]
MVSWPALGTRVTLRYRRPPGSVPPLTDAVGHLVAIDPTARVQTKSGAIIEVAPADVVALRVLTDAPVRTADIRALEHAVAAAWPGAEQTWSQGWLLRAHGATLDANAAVPLDNSAHISTVPAIVAWYTNRGLTPRLAIPDRLLSLPVGWQPERTEQVLVRAVEPREPDPAITVFSDGVHAFARHPAAGEVRAAVTDAPNGIRWVGLSTVLPYSVELCEALLAWGAGRGATRAHLCVPDTDPTAPADSLGFRLHHRRRYVLPPSR